MILCDLCSDAGLLRLTQSDFKTLAKCWCERGKMLPWKLPTIPMKGFEHQALNYLEFMPVKRPQSLGQAKDVIAQKIDWLTAQIRIAEAYWASQGEL